MPARMDMILLNLILIKLRVICIIILLVLSNYIKSLDLNTMVKLKIDLYYAKNCNKRRVYYVENRRLRIQDSKENTNENTKNKYIY